MLEPLLLEADGSSGLLDGPNDAELCSFLAAACSGFLADGSSRSASQEPSGPDQQQPLSSVACSLARSDSGASSGAPALSALQPPLGSAPGCNIGPGGKRKRGRPRRYDTTLPLLPGQAPCPVKF
jgi:hypothetical protein